MAEAKLSKVQSVVKKINKKPTRLQAGGALSQSLGSRCYGFFFFFFSSPPWVSASGLNENAAPGITGWTRPHPGTENFLGFG